MNLIVWENIENCQAKLTHNSNYPQKYNLAQKVLEIKDLLAQHFHKSCADLMVIVLDRTIGIAKISNLSSKILPKFGNKNSMRTATWINYFTQ